MLVRPDLSLDLYILFRSASKSPSHLDHIQRTTSFRPSGKRLFHHERTHYNQTHFYMLYFTSFYVNALDHHHVLDTLQLTYPMYTVAD